MADRERIIENGRVENQADLRVAGTLDISNPGKVEDGVGNRLVVGFVHRHHDVKVANRVFSASCTSCKGCPVYAVQRRNLSLKGFTVAKADVKTSTGPEPREQLNTVQHALLRFGSKALHGSNLVVQGRFFEAGYRVDAEFVRHEFDSLRPQSRDAQHLDEAGWCAGVKVHPVVGPAALRNGLCQCASQALSNPLHVENLAAGHEFSEVFGQASQHAAGVLIRANSEDIGTLQFEEDRHLMEDVGHLVSREKRRPVGARFGKCKTAACHDGKRGGTLHKGSLVPPCSRMREGWKGHGRCVGGGIVG